MVSLSISSADLSLLRGIHTSRAVPQSNFALDERERVTKGDLFALRVKKEEGEKKEREIRRDSRSLWSLAHGRGSSQGRREGRMGKIRN